MNETEERAFKIAFEFYRKWRDGVIETEDQWLAWAEDWKNAFAPVFKTPIGKHLAAAVFDAFSDMYRNGMKPMPADYFGRDDL